MMNQTLNRRALLGTVGIGLAALVVTRGTAAQGRFPYVLTDAEWRRRLGPERYRVLRSAGTERAFTSPLNKEHRRGRYVCAGCANPLFASATKYDSGTGWPSFFRVLPGGTAKRGLDNMFFGTEIACARCGGHLGHVFNDGPRPTGLRYCMNGIALRFELA